MEQKDCCGINYVFDKKRKTLTRFIKDCPDFSMDQSGNIYYTQNSEDFLSKTLYVSNIKEPSSKHQIAKISGSIKMYSYTLNGKNRTYALIDDKLHELKDQSLQPISIISLSDNISVALEDICLFNSKFFDIQHLHKHLLKKISNLP